uniref:Uncharacterized protein n=1 Tax=Coccidioides posadasii RMSCC 3488 TaxID=454284 RepID=A0A0J6FPS5_COCPO|nr:hypothetical protein CPAG_07283 [Coccidioides posadasii RMSCC 3488]
MRKANSRRRRLRRFGRLPPQWVVTTRQLAQSLPSVTIGRGSQPIEQGVSISATSFGEHHFQSSVFSRFPCPTARDHYHRAARTQMASFTKCDKHSPIFVANGFGVLLDAAVSET